MPKLKTIFGKHDVGSDELLVFNVVEIFTHLIWILFGIHGDYMQHCQNTHLDMTEFYFSIIPRCFIAKIIISLLISRVSLQGTVINSAPRNKISYLIVLEFFLDIIVLVFHVASTIELQWYGWCSGRVVGAILVLTIIHYITVCNNWHWFILKYFSIKAFIPSWIPNIIHDRMYIWIVDKLGIYEYLEKSIIFHQMIQLSSETLELMIPRGDLDVTHGDVITSLVILSEIQKRQRMERNECTCMDSTEPIVLYPWMTIGNALHYSKLASGIYGWKMFAIQSGKLCKEFLRGISEHRGSYFLLFTQTEFCDYVAFLVLTGTDKSDVVHIELKSSAFQLGFVVLLDHRLKKLVVVLRGSQYITDFIIDMLAFEHHSLDVPEVKDARVHYGVYETAKKMMGLLIEPQEGNDVTILEKAKKKIIKEVGEEQAKEYNTVLVGHSLGAAVGAVMTLLLRKHEEYKDSICFAFSPPAGLMSESLANHTSSFVFTIFMEHDIVSRCDNFQVIDGQLKILKVLRHCDISKYKVMKRSGIDGWNESIMNKVLSSGVQPSWYQDYNAERDVSFYQNHLDEAINELESDLSKARKFYLPGTLLMIREKVSMSGKKEHKTYEAHFCQRTTEELSRISFHRYVIRHHFPFVISKALLYLIKSDR